MFPALDDASFVAPNPESEAGRLSALTGVSRGLARFGFLERFENTAPCDFSIVVPGVPGKVVCLPRGAADVRPIARSPAASDPGCVDLADIRALLRISYVRHVLRRIDGRRTPAGTREVKVRVSASRDRFMPAFAVYVRGSRRPIAVFDLDGMSVHEIAEYRRGRLRVASAGPTTRERRSDAGRSP